MASLGRNARQQRSTAANMTYQNIQQSKEAHFASQNFLNPPPYPVQRRPKTRQGNPSLNLMGAAFGSELQSNHNKGKSHATNVFEIGSQFSQKDGLRNYLKEYQSQQLPEQNMCHKKRRKISQVMKQMSTIISDFSGRTVHDRDEMPEPVRDLAIRSNYLSRPTSKASNTRTVQKPRRNVFQRFQTLKTQPDTESPFIIRIFSKTFLDNSIKGDNIKLPASFLLHLREKVGPTELKLIQESTGVLVKLSSISTVLKEEQNFMKTNEPKNSYLQAFWAQIDLKGSLVAKAMNIDFNEEYQNNYKLEDSDSVAMPSWIFKKLKMNPGEPISITFDRNLHSLVPFLVQNPIKVVEVHPFQRNYTEICDTDELVNLMESHDKSPTKNFQEQVAKQADLTQAAISTKLMSIFKDFRVLQKNQVITYKSKQGSFQFKILKLYDNLNNEMGNQSLNLNFGNYLSQVIINNDIDSQDDEPEENLHLTHKTPPSALGHTIKSNQTNTDLTMPSKKLDLNVVFKQHGFDIFHMQNMINEHKRQQQALLMPPMNSKSSRQHRQSKSANPMNMNRRPVSKLNSGIMNGTDIGKNSILTKPQNSPQGLKDAIEVQGVLDDFAMETVVRPESKMNSGASAFKAVITNHTSVNRSIERTLDRNAAKSGLSDPATVILGRRQISKGEVQLNYIMLGQQQNFQVAPDEYQQRQSFEKALANQDDGETERRIKSPDEEQLNDKKIETTTDMEALLSNDDAIRQSGEATLIASLMQSKENQQESEEDTRNAGVSKKPTEEPVKFDETPDGQRDFGILNPRLSNEKLTGIKEETQIVQESYVPLDPSEIVTVENSLNVGTFHITEQATQKLNKIQLSDINKPREVKQESFQGQPAVDKSQCLQIASQDSKESDLRQNKMATVRVSNERKGVFSTEYNPEIQSSAEGLNEDIKHNMQSNKDNSISPVSSQREQNQPPIRKKMKFPIQHVSTKHLPYKNKNVSSSHLSMVRNFAQKESFIAFQTNRRQSDDSGPKKEAEMVMQQPHIPKVTTHPTNQSRMSRISENSQDKIVSPKKNTRNNSSIFYRTNNLYGIKSQKINSMTAKSRGRSLSTTIFWGQPEFPDNHKIVIPKQESESKIICQPECRSLSNGRGRKDIYKDINANHISLKALKQMLDICINMHQKFRARLIPAHVAGFFQTELVKVLLQQQKQNNMLMAEDKCSDYLKNLEIVLNQQVYAGSRSLSPSSVLHAASTDLDRINSRLVASSTAMLRQISKGSVKRRAAPLAQSLQSSANKNEDFQVQENRASTAAWGRITSSDKRLSEIRQSADESSISKNQLSRKSKGRLVSKLGLAAAIRHSSKAAESDGNVGLSDVQLTPKIIDLQGPRVMKAQINTILTSNNTSKTKPVLKEGSQEEYLRSSSKGMIHPSIGFDDQIRMDDQLKRSSVEDYDVSPSKTRGLKAVFESRSKVTDSKERKKLTRDTYMPKSIKNLDAPFKSDGMDFVGSASHIHTGKFRTIAQRNGAKHLRVNKMKLKQSPMQSPVNKNYKGISIDFFNTFMVTQNQYVQANDLGSPIAVNTGSLGHIGGGTIDSCEALTPPNMAESREMIGSMRTRGMSPTSILSTNYHGMQAVIPNLAELDAYNIRSRVMSDVENGQKVRILEDLKGMLSIPIDERILHRAASQSRTRLSRKTSNDLGRRERSHPVSAAYRKQRDLHNKVSEAVRVSEKKSLRREN